MNKSELVEALANEKDLTYNRITSYNVCYTKLLRAIDFAVKVAAADGEGADRFAVVGVGQGDEAGLLRDS